VVNLSIDTLAVDDASATLVLVLYMTLLSGSALAFARWVG